MTKVNKKVRKYFECVCFRSFHFHIAPRCTSLNIAHKGMVCRRKVWSCWPGVEGMSWTWRAFRILFLWQQNFLPSPPVSKKFLAFGHACRVCHSSSHWIGGKDTCPIRHPILDPLQVSSSPEKGREGGRATWPHTYVSSSGVYVSNVAVMPLLSVSCLRVLD